LEVLTFNADKLPLDDEVCNGETNPNPFENLLLLEPSEDPETVEVRLAPAPIILLVLLLLLAFELPADDDDAFFANRILVCNDSSHSFISVSPFGQSKVQTLSTTAPVTSSAPYPLNSKMNSNFSSPVPIFEEGWS
jgi:hypothetical protein